MTPSPRRAVVIALVIGSLIGRPPRIDAGPVVLRDEMITDRAVTPSLGRGYSIATNTYQSSCFKTIKTTKPSYNFYYLFEQLDSGGGGTPDVAVTPQGTSGVPEDAIEIDTAGSKRQYLKVSIDME